MTFQDFVMRLVMKKEFYVEFSRSTNPNGFRIKLSKIMDGKYYSIVYDTDIGMVDRIQTDYDISIWESLYDMLLLKMKDIKSNDPVIQKDFPLSKYVRDFIYTNRIDSGEKIWQTDWDDTLYVFLDECCKLVGYYERED